MLKKLGIENALFGQSMKILVINAASEKRILDDAIRIFKNKSVSQLSETEFFVI